MLYLLLFIYMLIFPIAEVTLLYRILEKIDTKKETNVNENRTLRTHASVKQSNFENAFGGRKAYDVYKNKNGLYEPITPSKGIELKKED